MGRPPIRPLIVVEAIPNEVDKGQTISISARLFDKKSLLPLEVSKIFMTITSEKDGHTVWPMEVVRKNAAGFDIMIGTEDMKEDHTYLIRVSNNSNLSPSAATTFGIRKKNTVLPIILLPIIPLIPLVLREPVDSSRQVEKYIFRTQMDHRVCPICQQYEDQEFKPNQTDIPKIPIHHNCRCTVDVIYVTPDKVTQDMRNAAQAAMIIERTKVPLEAIKVITANYY